MLENVLACLALPQFGACRDPVVACSHSSHQVCMLSGCGCVRAVLVERSAAGIPAHLAVVVCGDLTP